MPLMHRLSFVEIYPYTVAIIKRAAQTETAAGPLEGLCFCARAGIVVVRPLFSSGGVGTQAEESSIRR
jgi:hypothetical protein